MYGVHLEERCGDGVTFDADVWIHAVSMGEMRSAVPLVQQLLSGGHRVVTTHATPAGRRAAEDAFGDQIEAGRLTVSYAPVDRPDYWRAFFKRTAPRVGLVMEMGFWPAMIEAACDAGVPLCLTNSQVPEKSFRRARRLARMFGHPASRAAVVFAKSQRMGERFKALGAEQVETMGETRFDIPPPADHLEAAGALGIARPVVTLASVVEGEEDTYLAAIQELHAAGGAVPLFIWVPRAPELFDATAERLRKAGLTVAKRSEVLDAGLNLNAGKNLDELDVLIGDSMGEMFFYLAPADLVIVGGGFVEKGAHNVIEPLALGKPVIVGPATWTIEFPGEEAEAAGVLRVCLLPRDLARAILDGLAGGNSAKAEAFHAAYAGASGRITARITPLLEGREE